MSTSIDKRQQQDFLIEPMRYLDDTNLSVSAPTAGESSLLGGGVSFRLRRRSTALGLLNRGLANWYPGSSEDVVLKDEDEQLEFDRQMEVLMKNPHVFAIFKDRVAASESYSNPMAARMVLEEFLQKDLLFVGKQGVIHRHSNLIKHLALTQRSHGGNTSSGSSVSSSPSSRKLPFRKPTTEKDLRESVVAETTKCDSFTVMESSDSSFSEDFHNSPKWSPGSGKNTVTFSGMPLVSPTLQVPMFDNETDEQVFESFVN
mmetsp:Transcript_7892/g.15053  ORF Transcript_7892/g.15053 Transcript_7892/m.15053 type:complete len:259 (-) Transcript_7892:137-913(-)|eukprot:scaffold2003_cov157-Amphora_coffeaeformis.AAC.5